MQVEEILVTVSVEGLKKKPIRLSGAGTSFTIGSSPLSDVFIDSEEVDVQHVLVTIPSEGTMVEIANTTVGSGSPVTVNYVGVSRSKRSNLVKGVTIRIGKTVRIKVEPLAKRELEPLANAS